MGRGWLGWVGSGSAVLVLLGGAAIWLRATAPAPTPRPASVVLIVADDLGLGQVSAFDAAASPATPGIDRIARSGVRFTSGYVTAPVCLPSRASILTGRYYQRFADPADVPRSSRMVSQLLAAEGYATGFIGKWHQGFDPPNHPMQWGFDEFFGFLGGLHDYREARLGLAAFRSALAGAATAHERRRILRFSPVLDGYDEVAGFSYLTRAFSERAVDFIGRHADRPFLLVLAYNAIHGPYQAPRDADDPEPASDPRGQARVLARMIEELDAGVGRVLDALDAHGLAASTAVIFVSDNGAAPLLGLPRVNGDLGGHKGTAGEGGIRVPFAMAWPAHLPAGITHDEPVSTLDLLPTIAAIAGVRSADGAVADGRDLLPRLLTAGGPGAPAPEGADERALFWGDGERGWHAARQGRWKILRRWDGDPWRLYDLAADPAETRDLADERPERVEALAAAWRAWRTEVDPARQASP